MVVDYFHSLLYDPKTMSDIIEAYSEIIKEILTPAKPIIYKSRSELTIGDSCYRIQPDEHFMFTNTHLLIEYEKNKRPVESISKYWWLFYRSNWLQNKQKLILVFILLDDYCNQIRSETVSLLGQELEKRFPESFNFFFIPPDNSNIQIFKNILGQALRSALLEIPT
jgi:hypothetical protein